jgi:hypothetical protein
MGRLSASAWERVRAEYEIRGTSKKQLAEQFQVDRAAILRHARKEGWEQGKSHHLVKKIINYIYMLAKFEEESHTLPVPMRRILDAAVAEELEAEGFSKQKVKALMANRYNMVGLDMTAMLAVAKETLRLRRQLYGMIPLGD